MFNIKIKKPRFFTTQGVEIFPCDFPYLKSQTLYLSDGEGFNANTCFAEYDIIYNMKDKKHLEKILDKSLQSIQENDYSQNDNSTDQ